jgi:hypothetical protein
MESKLPNSAALSSPSFEFSSCNDPELALRTASQDVSMTTPGGGWWGDAPAQDRENGNDNDGVDGTSRSSTQSGNIKWAQICAHLNLELRKCLITFPILVPSQRLIARNVCELFSFNRGVSHLNNACCIDDVSRGSLSCYEILTNN